MAVQRLFVVVLLFFTGLCANAQKPDEPQYANQVAALGADGKLTELEKQTAKIEAKGHSYIVVTKSTVRYAISGPHSPVRTPPGESFVVRLHIGDMDPTTMIHLYKLDADKNSRFYKAAGSSASILGAKTDTADPNTVPIKMDKYGDNSYKITTQQPLEPGEYAFVAMGLNAQCFGVDSK